MVGPKQHFVPKYYLNAFSAEGEVFVFDKKENRYLDEKGIPVNKIGFSKNFYDIEPRYLSRFLVVETEEKSYVDLLIEKYNERISSPLIKSFIDLGDEVYKHKKKEIVSFIRMNDIIDFLVVQLFRTPSFRKQFEFKARDIFKIHLDNINQKESNSVESLTRVMHGLYIVSAICNTEIFKNSGQKHLIKPSFQFVDFDVFEIFKQIKGMSKTMCISALDSYYFTSDNPIYIQYNDNGKIEMLFFPLTKRCSMTFWNNEYADKNVLIINEKSKHVLEEQNQLMKDWAQRFIYSYNKD